MRATIIIAKLNPKISVVEKLDDCNALISSKKLFFCEHGALPKIKTVIYIKMLPKRDCNEITNRHIGRFEVQGGEIVEALPCSITPDLIL